MSLKVRGQVRFLYNLGEYNILAQNVNTNCSVSFVDKVPRKLWEIPITPGPGQYDFNN